MGEVAEPFRIWSRFADCPMIVEELVIERKRSKINGKRADKLFKANIHRERFLISMIFADLLILETINKAFVVSKNDYLSLFLRGFKQFVFNCFQTIPIVFTNKSLKKRL